MKRLFPVAVLIPIVLSFMIIVPAASAISTLQGGSVLLYRYVRSSTSDQAQQTGDALYKVLSYDGESLSFNITSTSEFSYTIQYRDGVPKYAERYEVLFYLPPVCIEQTKNGDLNWIDGVQTPKESVGNCTSKPMNYTVEAGTFQCVEIILEIGGMDAGNLSLAYDIESGIMVHAQYNPSYGDVIVQQLASEDYAQTTRGLTNQILGVGLFAGVLVMPVFMVIGIIRKHATGAREKGANPDMDDVVNSNVDRKTLIVLFVSALISLLAFLLPWGATSSLPSYLPFSFTPMILSSSFLLPSNFVFVLVTVAVFFSVLSAWLSIILYLRGLKKLRSYLVSVVSSILGFVSAVVFWLTGWTPSLGFYAILAGSILTLIGVGVANVHIVIEIEPEGKPSSQNSSETSTSE